MWKELLRINLSFADGLPRLRHQVGDVLAWELVLVLLEGANFGPVAP